MGSLPWIGLVVFVVGAVAGLLFVAARGLAAWRTLRSFQSRLAVAMAETTRLLDGIEPRVAAANASAQRLEEARTSLEESTASARVLFTALGEAVALVQRIRAFAPI